MARIRMSAAAVAYEVHALAPELEIILHFTTRDRNLMGLQSDLLGCHALGLRNILCLTGDPPSLGDYPDATAVYDTDSVGLIRIIGEMNQGRDLAGNSIGAATSFAMGCGVNPTAEDLDAELEHFRRKLDVGARFVMTQPVYELAAWERFLERLGGAPGVPILVGILPLRSFRHAEFLHNEVPGIHVPDWVRARMRDAGNSGERAGIELARDLLARCRASAAGVYLMPSFGRYENCLEVLEGTMMGLLLYFVLIGGTMLLLSRFLPGFTVTSWQAAFWAAFWLAIVNTVLKPVLFLLTLPLTIVTLGLFLIVLNALMLWLTAYFVRGFDIPGGFFTTVVASIVLSVVGGPLEEHGARMTRSTRAPARPGRRGAARAAVPVPIPANRSSSTGSRPRGCAAAARSAAPT
jgi:5,10-methylenetetrahydrofolate reductase